MFRKSLALSLVVAHLAWSSIAHAVDNPLLVPTTAGQSGLQVINKINDAIASTVTCSSGTSAPTNGPGGLPYPQQCWWDTTAAPVWVLKFYDSTTWVTMATLNTGTHVLALSANVINGVSFPSGPTANQIPIALDSTTVAYVSVPDCTDAAGKHLNFVASTHSFVCGTSEPAFYIRPFSIDGMLPEFEDANTVRFYDGCAAEGVHVPAVQYCYSRTDTHFDVHSNEGVDSTLSLPLANGTVLWPWAYRCSDLTDHLFWGAGQTPATSTFPCTLAGGMTPRQLPFTMTFTNTGIRQWNGEGWPGNMGVAFPLMDTSGDYDVRDTGGLFYRNFNTGGVWANVEFTFQCAGSMRGLYVQGELTYNGAPGTMFIRSNGGGSSGFPVVSVGENDATPRYGVAYVQGSGDCAGTCGANQFQVMTTGTVKGNLRLMKCVQTGQ